MTAKSSACQSPLQKHDSVDIVVQRKDIDPSRLSLPPFLDLDSQISLPPISGSCESSEEELCSSEEQHVQEESDCRLGVVNIPEDVVVDLMGQPKVSVVQKDPRPTAAIEPTSSGVEGAQTIVIMMPEETSFLDTPQPQSGSPQKSVVQQGHFLELKATKPISHHCSGDSTRLHRGCGCSSAHMKAVASAFMALLIIPCFLYACYYYAPLDVPACPNLTSRITFALRSLLMAGIPVLLGITFRSMTTLCRNSLEPLNAPSRTTLLHQVFVASSVEQFVLFSLNLLVTATFLPQERLRLIPIMAGLFFISRFCYWVALLRCSSFRSFGFGLTFFPSLCLTLYNFYCLSNLGFGFLFMPAPSGYIHPTAAPISPKEVISN